MKLYLPVDKEIVEIHFIHSVENEFVAYCTQWDMAKQGAFVSFTKLVPTCGENPADYTTGQEYMVPVSNIAAIVSRSEKKKISYKR